MAETMAEVASERRIIITEAAARRIAALKQQEKAESAFLRIAVSGGGCSGFQYGLSLDDQHNPDDLLFERDGVTVIVDDVSLELLNGAELDFVDTALWYPKMARRDYTVGAVPMESGVDDPDQMYYENYVCGAARNYTGYCNPDLDKLVNQQSMEANPEKRKQIVWQIERLLANAAVRPVLFYPAGATCRQPYVKGLTLMTNSIYNEWRMEDVWLDK